MAYSTVEGFLPYKNIISTPIMMQNFWGYTFNYILSGCCLLYFYRTMELSNQQCKLDRYLLNLYEKLRVYCIVTPASMILVLGKWLVTPKLRVSNQQIGSFNNDINKNYPIIKKILEKANQGSCSFNHLFVKNNIGYLLSTKHNCIYSFNLLNKELIAINSTNFIKFYHIKDRINFRSGYNYRITIVYGSIGTNPLIINPSTEEEYENWYTFLTQILEEKEKTKISINGDNNVIQFSKGLNGYNKIYYN